MKKCFLKNRVSAIFFVKILTWLSLLTISFWTPLSLSQNTTTDPNIFVPVQPTTPPPSNFSTPPPPPSLPPPSFGQPTISPQFNSNPNTRTNNPSFNPNSYNSNMGTNLNNPSFNNGATAIPNSNDGGKTVYDPNRVNTVTTEEVIVTENLKLKKRLKDLFAKVYLEYWLGRKKKTGVLKIKLYHLQAPQTVENFVQLSEGQIEFKLPNQDKPVKKPFYDGLKFHRIVKRFVAQSGDPTGSSRGLGPGYTIPLEINGGLVHDRMGVVSMARSGDSSHGSQFFITLTPIPNLNGVNTIFGQVVDGANVLNDFDKIQTNREDIPKRPVLIKKIEIERIYL